MNDLAARCFAFALWVAQQPHADAHAKSLAQLSIDFWYEGDYRQCASYGVSAQHFYYIYREPDRP